MGPDRLGNGPGYRHRAPLGPKHPWFCVDSVYVARSSNLGFDRGTAPHQNGFSQRSAGHYPNQPKQRTNALPQQQTTSQRASARTSTGERRPCGLADWMFLIFLLLFGSSQKEGVRLPDTTVESNENGPGIKILFLVRLRLGLLRCDLESRIRQGYGSLRKPLSQK